jgi:hypothetical protein
VRKASGPQPGAGVSDKRDAGGRLFYASLFFSRLADQILLFLVPLVVFASTTAFSQVLHLPGLRKVIALAAGVNLVIGVTLATSAAMVTGLLQRSPGDYALLQTAGAVATVLILLLIARTYWSLRTLGLVSYSVILAGGLLTGLGRHFWVYTTGFLLVVGFDKMFSVYIRSLRQKLIPPRDLGKTTGVIVMLNNLSQPAAGLLVGAFAGATETRGVILGLVLVMGVMGLAAAWAGRRQ